MVDLSPRTLKQSNRLTLYLTPETKRRLERLMRVYRIPASRIIAAAITEMDLTTK